MSTEKLYYSVEQTESVKKAKIKAVFYIRYNTNKKLHRTSIFR